MEHSVTYQAILKEEGPRGKRAGVGAVALIMRPLPILLASLTLLACTDTDLRRRVAALERQNRALEAELKAVKLRLAQGGDGASSLLAGLLGQLQAGGSGLARPLDPALQARLDRVMVEGLEKLSKSDDAKNAVKSLLRMVAAGTDPRRGDAEAPEPSSAPARCEALGRAVTAAIANAAPCSSNAECTVERFTTCGLEGMHCYTAICNRSRGQAVRSAIQAYRDGCAEQRRCRCRAPDGAVCRAGRCVPR